MEPTPAGWTIMIVSIGAVCALTAYCFWKLMTIPPREVVEHLKAPLDIDTKDLQQPD